MREEIFAKKVPVEEFTTPSPFTVKRHTSIQEIVQLMREHGFRHVPVLDDKGGVVGVISDGDIKLAATFKEAESLEAEEIMSDLLFINRCQLAKCICTRTLRATLIGRKDYNSR